MPFFTHATFVNVASQITNNIITENKLVEGAVAFDALDDGLEALLWGL